LTEITRGSSQIFFVCLVGVWQRNFEPSVCVHGSAHTPKVQNCHWFCFCTGYSQFSNVKFYENPSRGSRDVPCGRTDGRTDMTKLIVAFLNFANAP